jgi:hypothetical protein
MTDDGLVMLTSLVRLTSLSITPLGFMVSRQAVMHLSRLSHLHDLELGLPDSRQVQFCFLWLPYSRNRITIPI